MATRAALRVSMLLRVAAAPGAPIISYTVDGHEWCAAGPWSEHAPTGAACTLPSFVGGAARVDLPEGGLLIRGQPAIDVVADGATNAITCVWPRLPYPLDWQRSVTIDDDRALVVRYAVRNAHSARLPFVWSSRLRLAWDPSVALEIARGSRSRVAESHGEGMAPPASEFAWPSLRDGGTLADLAHPAQLAAGRAVRCYIELARPRFVVRAGHAFLEVLGEPGVVTHAQVWINHDADIGAARPRRWWRKHQPVVALAVGASVGAPASLSDAVGGWRSARWLEAGETLEWTMRYRPHVA
jgi:hypothetical protein